MQNAEMEGQGAIAVIWEVQCSYREIIVVQADSTNQEQVKGENEVETTAESPENAET